MDSERPDQDHPLPQRPQPRRRLWPRVLGVFALLLIALMAFIAWAVATQSGARWVVAQALSTTGGAVSVQGVQGSLTGPLRLDELRQSKDGQELIASGVQLRWQPSALFSRHLHIDLLEIDKLVVVTSVKSDPEPPKLPASLALPLQITLDQLKIKATEIRRGPLPLATLGPLALAADYDGARYRLRLDPLAMSTSQAPVLAQVQGEATLADSAPYALQGQLTLASQAQVGDQAFKGGGQARLGGNLSALDLLLDLDLAQTAQAARVQGRVQLLPFSDRPLGPSQLNAKALDLSFFNAAAPATALDLSMAVDGAGRGQLQIANSAAGPWSQQKLPLSRLHLAFAQQARRFVFQDIDARLGHGKKDAGRIQGSGDFAGGALQLALHLTGVDLSGLDARARRTALSGRVDLRHTDDADHLQLDLTERGALPLALQARASLAQSAVNIEQALLKAAGGEVRMSGQARLDGEQALRAQGSFERFSPRAFGNFPRLPDLLLNGRFTLVGKRAPQLAGTLQFELKDSRLAGQALQGQGKLHLAGQSLEVPQFMLQAGDNKVELSGKLSPAKESGSLRYGLELARLEQLGLGWRGALKGQGTLQGQARAPLIDGQFDAQNLDIPGVARLQAGQLKLHAAIDPKSPMAIASMQADAQLQQLSASGKTASTQSIASSTLNLRYGAKSRAPLQLKLLARDLRDGEQRLDQIEINADGTNDAHVVNLLAQRGKQSLNASAAGGLDFKGSKPEWRGQLTRLESQGPLAARLLAPARMALAAKRQTLEALRLETTVGRIEVESFTHEGSDITTRGRLTQLEPGKLLALLPKPPPVATDLVLDGEWDLALGTRLSGQASLRRSRGDLTVQGASPVALGLSQLQASLKAQGNRVDVSFDAAGRRLGQLNLNASAALTTQNRQTRIAANAPLTGSAHVDIPAIDWVAGLVSPALITEGRLQSELKIAGTLDEPRLSGQVAGDRLRVFLTEPGVDLRQGQLAGSFTEDRFLLERLRFASGDGELALSGPIRLAGGHPTGELKLLARRYPLLNRSDRRIVVSGDSNIALAEQGLKMRGRFRVDQGAIDIGQSELPQLSDDVVIVGRQKKEGKPLATDIALTIDLGDQLRLQGRGLKARLAGELNIQNRPGQTLETQGIVRVAEGTFSAYGRELAIEQGVLRFTGAINNPALDITAMRRGQEVAAGVSLRGTVLSPRITLVSDPTVPDADKLSWLVLGRGMSSSTGGADAASLQAAAASLLSGGAAAGAQSQIASHFGIDSVGLSRSSDSLQQRVVTLGKQVSDRLFVSVAQGLETSNPALRLRYTLSSKLTAEVEAGTISFLSLFYNIAFD